MPISEIEGVIKLLTSIVTLGLLIFGAKMISDLKLRGVDAICGFHARLKVGLKDLKRAACKDKGIVMEQNEDDSEDDSEDETGAAVERKDDTAAGSETEDEIAAASSAFMHLSSGNKTISYLTGKYTNCFSESEFQAFFECVKSINKFFLDTNGQVPLSKKMYDDLGRFNQIISDVIADKEQGKPFPKNPDSPEDGELLNTCADIKEKSDDFCNLIDSIIEEIDVGTKRLLKGLWGRRGARKG